MTNRPITLQEAAMRFGTFMGFFWIIKFSFIPLGFSVPLLHLLFILLTLFVPVLGYIYTKKYRDMYSEGRLTFGQGFLFSLFMYIAAIMLAFLAHYTYFRYLDNGFLVNIYQEQLNATKELAQGEMISLMEQSIRIFDEIASWTPLQKTFWMAWQNIFYCTPLAVITGLLTMKRNKQ